MMLKMMMVIIMVVLTMMVMMAALLMMDDGDDDGNQNVRFILPWVNIFQPWLLLRSLTLFGRLSASPRTLATHAQTPEALK